MNGTTPFNTYLEFAYPSSHKSDRVDWSLNMSTHQLYLDTVVVRLVSPEVDQHMAVTQTLDNAPNSTQTNVAHTVDSPLDSGGDQAGNLKVELKPCHFAGLGAAGKGASVRSKAGWTKKAAGTGHSTATGIAEPVTKAIFTTQNSSETNVFSNAYFA